MKYMHWFSPSSLCYMAINALTDIHFYTTFRRRLKWLLKGNERKKNRPKDKKNVSTVFWESNAWINLEFNSDNNYLLHYCRQRLERRNNECSWMAWSYHQLFGVQRSTFAWRVNRWVLAGEKLSDVSQSKITQDLYLEKWVKAIVWKDKYKFTVKLQDIPKNFPKSLTV